MYSLLLCFNLLFSPVFLSTISILYAMPKAESEEEEDASDSKTAASKPQSAEKTAIDSTSDAESAVPSTQLTTIELEKDSSKAIVKISNEKNIEEFSRLFDAAKKIHEEMSEILASLEEMRNNLVQSFQDAANKLDPILQDAGFQVGKMSNNTLPTLQQSPGEQGRKK